VFCGRIHLVGSISVVFSKDSGYEPVVLGHNYPCSFSFHGIGCRPTRVHDSGTRAQHGCPTRIWIEAPSYYIPLSRIPFILRGPDWKSKFSGHLDPFIFKDNISRPQARNSLWKITTCLEEGPFAAGSIRSGWPLFTSTHISLKFDHFEDYKRSISSGACCRNGADCEVRRVHSVVPAWYARRRETPGFQGRLPRPNLRLSLVLYKVLGRVCLE